ncbi:hypothetical protein EPO05_02270 [Patescibacteria group bacterium]|nr:MAG: hypothetical protein EPO05_02270 [Patescibacteria group bacterium]
MESSHIEHAPERQHPGPKKGIPINSIKTAGLDDIPQIRERMSALRIDDLQHRLHQDFPQMELVQRETRKIDCKYYNYPYSNCVIFALGDEQSELDFHMRSRSMLFSLLHQEYDEIEYGEIKPGDIAVYYWKEEGDPNTPENDHTYEHVGKITDDLKILSQWGLKLGVYKHPIPLVFDFCGDSVVFMRKQLKQDE